MFIEMLNENQVTLIHINVTHLDASNADDLYESIKKKLKGTSLVVIDLSGLELIDSSGLGFLLNCNRDIQQATGVMRTVTRNSMVLSLFELVYFNKVVEVFDSISNAIYMPKVS
jgi:anti-sigma B factor antagonist